MFRDIPVITANLCDQLQDICERLPVGKFVLLFTQKKQGFSDGSCMVQEEENMDQDMGWKEYFSDDSRYADLINGVVCGGRQMISEGHLKEADTQTVFFGRRYLRQNGLRQVREDAGG